MTLVTTPGDAATDSYAALDATNTYFANRGIATWIGTDTVKENALRRATSYLDNAYRDRWKGIRTYQTQVLAWPRVDGERGYYRGYTQLLLDLDGWPVPQNTVPTQIATACMEAALLILTGNTLEPQLARGGMIKSQSDKVDVLESTTVWQDGAPAIDRYLVIEGLLRGFVTSTPGSSSGNVKLVRS